MAASTYLDQVQQLYIAYFGRPADPVGQRYWAQVIDDAGGSIASVLAGFSASNESQALYGASSTAQKVAAIYSNVFNRAPEAAGLAYWVSQIDSGKVTQAQAAYAIQQAAGAGDASTVNNKLIAANVFTANIDTTAEITGYSGSTSATVARAFLNKVDATYASIASVATYAVTDVAQATGTAPVAVAPVVPLPLFSAIVSGGSVYFIGTATGDITLSLSFSDATFNRAGNLSGPVKLYGAGAVSSVTLATNDTLVGSAATLAAGLTVNGTGSVKLTDTGTNLNGKYIAANSAHDTLTVTDVQGTTGLSHLTGFETINLSGSVSLTSLDIADDAGSIINTSVATSVTLGAAGHTFNGSAGNDTVRVLGGINTLTGGAGGDTFYLINGTSTITDLSTGDNVSIYAGSSATANNVAAFIANNNSANYSSSNSALTLNAAAAGSTIDMSGIFGGGAGYTIRGGAGIDVITGSWRADVLSGGAGTDTFVFIGNSMSNLSELDTLTDFTTGIDHIKTGVVGGVTSLHQGISYTAVGTGNLAIDIATAIAAGNPSGQAANDAYLVTITGTGISAVNYIFQDTSGDGVVDANELVIKLTGTSSITLAATDFIA
jgi:Ca2+-binding RTX toxin-like protein